MIALSIIRRSIDPFSQIACGNSPSTKSFVAKKIYIGDVTERTKKFSLVKVDTDSIDHLILLWFLGQIESGFVQVDTFTVEEPRAEACLKLSTMGYSTYISVNSHTAFKPAPEWASNG